MKGSGRVSFGHAQDRRVKTHLIWSNASAASVAQLLVHSVATGHDDLSADGQGDVRPRQLWLFLHHRVLFLLLFRLVALNVLTRALGGPPVALDMPLPLCRLRLFLFLPTDRDEVSHLLPIDFNAHLARSRKGRVEIRALGNLSEVRVAGEELGANG